MKRKKALKLSFDYMDTPERRVVSLAAAGGVPVKIADVLSRARAKAAR